MLDARYERVREAGVICSRAVLVAIGIDWDAQRQVLGVSLAGRESLTAWRDFLIGLKQRGLSGVHFVVTDQHEGLKQAVAEVLPTALWQRWRSVRRKRPSRCFRHSVWRHRGSWTWRSSGERKGNSG